MFRIRFPHNKVEMPTTRETWEQLEVTFIRPQNVIYDRLPLLTRRQGEAESFDKFYLAKKT